MSSSFVRPVRASAQANNAVQNSAMAAIEAWNKATTVAGNLIRANEPLKRRPIESHDRTESCGSQAFF
jgi:hypothetical protein